MVLTDQDQDLFPGTQDMIDPEDSLSMTDQGETERMIGIMIDHDQIQELRRLLFLDVSDVAAGHATR